MSLRHQLGALIHDWPRFLRHVRGDWTRLRNRNETLTFGPRGARCEWEFASDLHIASVSPFAARWLLRRALEDWPVVLRDEPLNASETPEVSFVIGHRGTERLPNLLATIGSIAAQTGAAIECIVVEQAARPEIRDQLPPWVRYLHTPVEPGIDYSRSAAFNAGVNAARADLLVLHDNDILAPERYAAEVVARAREGQQFIDLKRFVFYVSEADTRAVFAGLKSFDNLTTVITQNLQGHTIAAVRKAYAEIGGFDEAFVGWGGEDNEFWERAETREGVYNFGYLPMLHLWHAPQKGKEEGENAPAIRRYRELRQIPAVERIRRLTQ